MQVDTRQARRTGTRPCTRFLGWILEVVKWNNLAATPAGVCRSGPVPYRVDGASGKGTIDLTPVRHAGAPFSTFCIVEQVDLHVTAGQRTRMRGVAHIFSGTHRTLRVGAGCLERDTLPPSMRASVSRKARRCAFPPFGEAGG